MKPNLGDNVKILENGLISPYYLYAGSKGVIVGIIPSDALNCNIYIVRPVLRNGPVFGPELCLLESEISVLDTVHQVQ